MQTISTNDTGWTELQTSIAEWAAQHPHDFPWRTSLPPWQALVTEILLQRTRASAVESVYHEFFGRFSRPEELGEATEDEIRDAMYSLGLLWRARYLGDLGRRIAMHGVPSSVDDLRDLPGVGPYVSAAYLTLHQNERTPFVDANVVRLLARYWGFEYDGETRRKKWFLTLVDRLFENNFEPRTFGYALLDFTREVCGQTPACGECPVRASCVYANPDAGDVAE